MEFKMFGYTISIVKNSDFAKVRQAVKSHFGEVNFTTTDEKIAVIKFLREPRISKIIFKEYPNFPEEEVRGDADKHYVGLAFAKELAEYLFFDEMKSNNWFIK